MIVGNIKRLEIVVIGFDFRTVYNRKTERREKVHDSVLHLSQRVQTAARPVLPVDRNIDFLAIELRFELCRRELFKLFVERGLDFFPHVVYEFTRRRAFRRRNVAHILHNTGKLTAFTEISNLNSRQLVRVVGNLYSRKRLFENFVKLFFHTAS